MSVGRSRKLIKRHVPSGKDWGELLEGFRSAWPIIIVHHGDADVDAVEQIAVLACDGQDEALSLSAPPVFEGFIAVEQHKECDNLPQPMGFVRCRYRSGE